MAPSAVATALNKVRASSFIKSWHSIERSSQWRRK